MAAIITEKFRTHNAKQFREDFSESASSTYIFIGRSFDWSDENAPPSPANSIGEEIDAYSDMIALKKVANTDVSHGLVRRNWDSTGATSYDEYQHNISTSNTAVASGATNLFDSRFYVITDEYHVYKCIRTGRDSSGAVVASTVKPTGTSPTTLVSTSDTAAAAGRGYLWKYMYTVSASETIKFVTNDFIPVKTIGAQTEVDGESAIGTAASDNGTAQWDVENQAIDGAVYHIEVTAGGSGYNDGDYTAVAILGDGQNGECTVTVSSNVVSHITVTTNGSGYKRASVDIDNITGIGSGTNAVANVIISPIYGHGSSPIEELGGNYIIVNSRLEFNEGSGDFPTDNDFRRIGLIQDPFAKGTTTVSTSDSLTAYHQITVSGTGNISVDDTIMNSNSNGSGVAVSRVVSVDSTNNIVSHTPVANSGGQYVDFANSDTIYVGGVQVATTGGSAVSTTHPEVERFTGKIMYIENRGRVTRAADQIEDIKLIIEM